LDRAVTPNANIGGNRTKPGSVNALAVAYYQSPDFRSLADSTKGHRRRIIDKFRSKHGDKPLKGLRREHIAQIMADAAETPEAANNLIKLLRVMPELCRRSRHDRKQSGYRHKTVQEPWRWISHLDGG
jgi:hypothetical protein